MTVSRVAQNRRLEQLQLAAGELRVQDAPADRPLLRDGHQQTDDELLSKLAEIGIKLDRERLTKLVRQFPSAESLAHWLAKTDGVDPARCNDCADWLWISLVCLWERWCPDRPNFEQLDDDLEAGYAALRSHDAAAACRVWNRAWFRLTRLLEAFRFDSIDDMDACFLGSFSLTNWLYDYVAALRVASQLGVEWSAMRAFVCQHAVPLYELCDGSTHIVLDFQMALAETHFDLCQPADADHWFEKSVSLAANPLPILETWARHYSRPTPLRQLGRAEAIVRRALALAAPGQKSSLLALLADICDAAGRPEEAEALRTAALNDAAQDAGGVLRRAA